MNVNEISFKFIIHGGQKRTDILRLHQKRIRNLFLLIF
jgi:hypothetical protein